MRSVFNKSYDITGTENYNEMLYASAAPSVDPLLGYLQWQQSGTNSDCVMPSEYYYNKYCPLKNNSLTIAGCGPVAMAMIMNYWKWPLIAKIPNSIDINTGVPSVAKHYVTYTWDDMPESIVDGTSLTQVNAVARLLRDCGYAAYAIYGVNGTNTTNAPIRNAMNTTFSYHCSIFLLKTSYSESNWINKLKNNLQNGRPVLYTAWDTNDASGHYFVVDGYDTNNKFHINWGWGTDYLQYNKCWFTLISPIIPDSDTCFDSNFAAMMDIYPDPDCDNETTSSTIDDGDCEAIQTGGTITSTNNIKSGGKALFYGGNGVTLNPGFYAEEGSYVYILSGDHDCE